MCLCCTSLRGVAYFMVNVHMLGSFGLCAVSVYTYFFQPLTVPPGLEDVNPLFIQNFPLLLAGYAAAAAACSCIIYRSIDMESLFQLTWSVVSFGGFQFLVIFLHFLFTVMFRDLVAIQWQIIFSAVLVVNFCATVIYLTVLFLFGRKIHFYKYGQNIRNSIGNNLPIHSASSGVKKQKNNGTGVSSNPNPDLNLLENHPPVSRTNSVCKSTSTGDDLDEDSPPPPHSVAVQVEDDEDEEDEENETATIQHRTPPPSYEPSPNV